MLLRLLVFVALASCRTVEFHKHHFPHDFEIIMRKFGQVVNFKKLYMGVQLDWHDTQARWSGFYPGKVIKSFHKGHIVPDILDEFEPKCKIIPIFGQDPTHIYQIPRVRYGNRLGKRYLDHPPVKMHIICIDNYRTNWPSDQFKKRSGNLTIAMTGANAYWNKPKTNETVHWIVKIPKDTMVVDMNHLGNWNFDGNFTTLYPWKQPNPPIKTGWHRYIFVLLEGKNNNLTIPKADSWGPEPQFGLRWWARQNELKVVSGAFFRARGHTLPRPPTRVQRFKEFQEYHKFEKWFGHTEWLKIQKMFMAHGRCADWKTLPGMSCYLKQLSPFPTDHIPYHHHTNPHHNHMLQNRPLEPHVDYPVTTHPPSDFYRLDPHAGNAGRY